MISRSSDGRFWATLANSCWNLAVSSLPDGPGCGCVAISDYSLKNQVVPQDWPRMYAKKRERSGIQKAALPGFNSCSFACLRGYSGPGPASVLSGAEINFKRDIFICDGIPAETVQRLSLDP